MITVIKTIKMKSRYKYFLFIFLFIRYRLIDYVHFFKHGYIFLLFILHFHFYPQYNGKCQVSKGQIRLLSFAEIDTWATHDGSYQNQFISRNHFPICAISNHVKPYIRYDPRSHRDLGIFERRFSAA